MERDQWDARLKREEWDLEVNGGGVDWVHESGNGRTRVSG